MKRFRSLTVLFCSLAATVALVAAAAPAWASHAWTPYHWPRELNPFGVTLGNNLTGEWPGHLAATSTDWSASSVLDTTVVPGLQARPRQCRAMPGRVEVCNGKYGRNGWLGLASIWAVGDHIVQGTVKVNDTYFRMAAYDNPLARRHVMCQEVGHTLGLDHQTAASCMDDVNGLFDPAYVSPDAHDLEELATIYGHLDATTATAAAGAAADANDPAGSPGGGRRSVFERDLGDGRRLITWVVWAG